MIISTRISEARTHSRSGFTLVELMVAAALTGLVLWGVLSTNLQLLRSGVRITEYAEMESQVRRGLSQLGHDLRTAKGITWNGASDITLVVPDSSGATSQVTYAWTAATQSFFMVPGADSSVTTGRIYLIQGLPPLPDGSAGLTFARFDRDGNPAATDLATKRIQVSLTVDRRAQMGAAATEAAVASSFILRNKPVG